MISLSACKHIVSLISSSLGVSEHSGRWGRILEHIPLNFAMKLLDPLTPMLIRGAGLGEWTGAFYGCLYIQYVIAISKLKFPMQVTSD